jgi:hypothetical protein
MLAAKVAALVVLPLIVAVLVVEYRAVIVCLVLAVFPAVPFSYALAARKQAGAGGAVGITYGVTVAIVRAPTQPTTYRTTEVSSLSSHGVRSCTR